MNLVELNRKRAEDSNQCQDWTPLDALKSAVAHIESGEWPATMVYVAMAWKDTEGSMKRCYTSAARDHLEVMGLLSQHIVDRGSPD